MTDVRQALVWHLGEDLGNKAADDMAEAMGRTLDAAVFHGTKPIQENEMNANQITEVSATINAGLSQEDVDGMGEAERLALIVGSAYGAALAERDEARAGRDLLASAYTQARNFLEKVVPILEDSTWASDTSLAESIQAFLDGLDSDATPTQVQED